MIDLREYARAVFVNGARHAAIAGDYTRVEAVNELLIGPVAGMNRLLLGDDESAAAARAFGVIGGQARPRQIFLGQVGQVRRENDAVRYAGLSDANGGEEVLVLACHIVSLHTLPATLIERLYFRVAYQSVCPQV